MSEEPKKTEEQATNAETRPSKVKTYTYLESTADAIYKLLITLPFNQVNPLIEALRKPLKIEEFNVAEPKPSEGSVDEEAKQEAPAQEP